MSKSGICQEQNPIYFFFGFPAREFPDLHPSSGFLCEKVTVSIPILC